MTDYQYPKGSMAEALFGKLTDQVEQVKFSLTDQVEQVTLFQPPLLASTNMQVEQVVELVMKRLTPLLTQLTQQVEDVLVQLVPQLDKLTQQVEQDRGRSRAKGGRVRAVKLSPERRREIAMLGVAARKRKKHDCESSGTERVESLDREGGDNAR